GNITVDGKALTGTVYLRYQQEHFDSAAVVVANTGNQPTEMTVSVTGIPATPPKASGNGFTIKRTYYLPDGTEADLTNVHQNDGFEIENPDLSSSNGVADLSWLQVDQPAHVESRTDQYVAAFRYVEDTQSFSTAYMVRATSPGKFAMPGATIEDMYEPVLRANTGADTITVQLPGEGQPAPAKASAPAATMAPAGGAADATHDANSQSGGGASQMVTRTV